MRGAAQTPAAAIPILPAGHSSQRPLQLDHRHQLGLAVMPGIGYRVIARYNEDQTCLDARRDDSKWVCTNDVPFFLDFQLAYGITRRIDLMADVRLGLARDDAPGVGRQFAVAPGHARLAGPRRAAEVLHHVAGGVRPHRPGAVDDRKDTVADTDFGVRNSNGLMYDAIRNVGFYFQFGETIGFARWFRIELDVGLGVQVRFP